MVVVIGVTPDAERKNKAAAEPITASRKRAIAPTPPCAGLERLRRAFTSAVRREGRGEWLTRWRVELGGGGRVAKFKVQTDSKIRWTVCSGLFRRSPKISKDKARASGVKTSSTDSKVPRAEC